MTDSHANNTEAKRLAIRIIAVLLALIVAFTVVQFMALDAHAAGKCSNPYTVQRGDSWHKIARKCGVKFTELRDANKELSKELKRLKEAGKGDGRLKSNLVLVIPGAPQLGDEQTNCTPALRLHVGDQVVLADKKRNRVRAAPGLQATRIGWLKRGDVATVLDGPVCVDGINWWQIGIHDMVGWTAEGEDGKPYLTPVGSTASVSSKAWYPCANTYPSHLRKGQWVMVGDELPNRIRSKPRKGDNVIGKLETGVPVKITGGPKCNNGWVWWHVRSHNGSIKGWTSEGDGKDYWLIPAATAVQKHLAEFGGGSNEWFLIPTAEQLNCTEIKKSIRHLARGDQLYLYDGEQTPLAIPVEDPVNFLVMLPPWLDLDDDTWAFRLDAAQAACPRLSVKLNRIGTIQRFTAEFGGGSNEWFLSPSDVRLTCTEIEASLPELIRGDQLYLYDGEKSTSVRVVPITEPKDFYVMETDPFDDKADEAWAFRADEANEVCWSLSEALD